MFVLVSAGQSSCLGLNVGSSAFLLSGKCPIGTARDTFFQGLVRHAYVMDPVKSGDTPLCQKTVGNASVVTAVAYY